jgi:hypothetical protein
MKETTIHSLSLVNAAAARLLRYLGSAKEAQIEPIRMIIIMEIMIYIGQKTPFLRTESLGFSGS